jgi:prolyl-tRNA synthetase
VPVRIEVGPRDLGDGVVTIARRIGGVKETAPIEGVVAAVQAALDVAQIDLLAEAKVRREQATAEVETLDDAIAAGREGWAKVPWDVAREANNSPGGIGEGVTVRCLQRADGSLPDSEDEPDLVAYLARAY